MAPRPPYHGLHRKLVMALDVGTTWSGVSYCILDPGVSPEIKGVNRFPAQKEVGGAAKIPSILYYDREGNVRAAGAEALQPSVLESAESQKWVKVEWFKLHLRPKSIQSTHITDQDLPSLPHGKTATEVFADFLRYLYGCARAYINESHYNGVELWDALSASIQFILTHPNGWEGAQQSQMRQAAVLAGLIPDTPDGQARLQFVTEGEASLHFCVGNDFVSQSIMRGDGVIIVDAGGGTIDLSAYQMIPASNTFEEIALPECHLQGSVFVSRRTRAFLETKLRGSRYGSPDDINQITECFDKTTKLSFRSSADPQYIKFGSVRDKDLEYGIRSGQLKLPGQDVATLFQPSFQAITEAIEHQMQTASARISSVFLVGGFAANDWLFAQLQDYLQSKSISFCRPDGHLNKAVADGGVSFHIDHYVAVRVSKATYGMECTVYFDMHNPEHQRRSHYIGIKPSGKRYLPDAYQAILHKGTKVSEMKEFRQAFVRESVSAATFRSLTCEITCYKGKSQDPKWMDVDLDKMSVLCVVTADTSRIPSTISQLVGIGGNLYYEQHFDVVLLFGLTELKAQLRWMENGVEQQSPAAIVYEETAVAA